MDIDLLIGKHGQSGLLCRGGFKSSPMGAIFDVQTREITLEFDEDREPFHLNISVEERFCENLLTDRAMFVAFVQGDDIADSLEVPLLYLNDPYGGAFSGHAVIKTHQNISGFEQFIKRCSFAQPIHRDDLGDESTLNGILGGEDVRGLRFAPALIRQRELEKMPHYMPQAAPSAGLSLGGGAKQVRTSTGNISDDQ